MTIAVYARNTKDNYPYYLENLLALSTNENFKVIVFKPYLDFLNTTLNKSFKVDTYSNSEELIAKADYVISLGGDGTMLETLEYVRKSGRISATNPCPATGRSHGARPAVRPPCRSWSGSSPPGARRAGCAP